MDRRPLNIKASDRHPKLLLSSGHHLSPNEWPADGDKVRELLQQSVEAFLQYLDTVAVH
jgi:hypothetical protein